MLNTEIYDEIKVGKGLNNSSSVIERSADVLAQWEKRFIEAGAVDLNDFVSKDEFTNEVNKLNEAIENLIQNGVSNISVVQDGETLTLG